MLSVLATELPTLVSLFTLIGGIGLAIAYVKRLIKEENAAFNVLITNLTTKLDALDTKMKSMYNEFVTKQDHKDDMKELRTAVRDLRTDNEKNFASIQARLDVILMTNLKGNKHDE